MKKIDILRDHIINYKKKYLLNLKKLKFDTDTSSLATFRYLIFKTSNLAVNKDVFKKFKTINFKEQLKNFFYLRKFSSIEFHGIIKPNQIKKFKKIIISWSYKNCFSSSGLYIDPYFKISSSKKNILWILINYDDVVPKKFDKNIIIVHSQKKNFLAGVKNLINYLFYLIKNYNFNLKKIIHNMSYDSYLAISIKNFFIEKNFLKNIKKIYLPLESQPFQNAIINLAKQDKVQVTGFDHTLNPFPFYNTYSHLSPDIMNLHSKCSVKFYSKYLGWPRKKIKKKSSVRILKKNKKFFQNKIFLPISISNPNFILSKIEYIFKNYLTNNKNKTFKVCLHPSTLKEKKYLELAEKINRIQKNYLSESNSKNKNSISIHVGNLSTPLEALETGLEVIHITDSEIFDFISPKFWYSLNYTKLGNNIFKYRLKKFGHCVTFRKKGKSVII